MHPSGFHEITYLPLERQPGHVLSLSKSSSYRSRWSLIMPLFMCCQPQSTIERITRSSYPSAEDVLCEKYTLRNRDPCSKYVKLMIDIEGKCSWNNDAQHTGIQGVPILGWIFKMQDWIRVHPQIYIFWDNILLIIKLIERNIKSCSVNKLMFVASLCAFYDKIINIRSGILSQIEKYFWGFMYIIFYI